jgi:hypothetical protein
MDIIRLFRDYGVDHKTHGHKHCRPGWVNTECPFCEGNKGYHLGWNLNDEYFYCWRCDWHSPVKTISELISLPEYEVKRLLPQYDANLTVIRQKEFQKQEFQLPSGLMRLQENHKKYLVKRGFDPAELSVKWKIQGTGPISKLGNVSYKHRLFIPFFWNGKMVSFDTRDITGKAQNKYQACPKEYEFIEHKKILYGNQEAWDADLGICVEGPTDVWRMGELSFAVSGISYTNSQVRHIATIFKRVVVLFDDDPQAQVQAKKLVAELKFRGVDAFNYVIKGDPGSLTNEEAELLIKSL